MANISYGLGPGAPNMPDHIIAGIRGALDAAEDLCDSEDDFTQQQALDLARLLNDALTVALRGLT